MTRGLSMPGTPLVCMEQAWSSLLKAGGDGSSGTIARSTLTHLVGAGRVNSANYSTCLHRLSRVVALPAHPCGQDNKDCDGGETEQSGGGQGRCWTHNLCCWCARSGDGLQGGPRHVSFGGEGRPEKLGTELWRCGEGGVVATRPGRQGMSLAPLPAGSGSIATARGGRRWQLPEPKPPPSPALRASLAR